MNKITGYISVALVNITALICFTVLAIEFSHWWISLFGLLFMFSFKERSKENDEDVTEQKTQKL